MSSPDPLLLHNYEVLFTEFTLNPTADQTSDGSETGGELVLCSAAFSEVTGLEATMEPKVIKEGGRNYGPMQRVGPITFATVVLKRGFTVERDMYRWFHVVGGGNYAKRLNAYIWVRNPAADTALYVWKLNRALPIKYKMPDLNATATAVAIEELHVAHEGLELLSEGEALIAEIVKEARRTFRRFLSAFGAAS
jgi:phage tail-like protein